MIGNGTKGTFLIPDQRSARTDVFIYFGLTHCSPNCHSKLQIRYYRNNPNIHGTKMTLIPVTIRGLSWNNAEVPILSVLERFPETGAETGVVLTEVKKRYDFSKTDLAAIYASSGKRIIDSIIKFSRKNLIEKAEVYPIGKGCIEGIWKATPRGLQRAATVVGDWTPVYSKYQGLFNR